MNIFVLMFSYPLNNRIFIMKKVITLLTVLTTAFIFAPTSVEAHTSSSKDYTYKSGVPHYTQKVFSHYDSSRRPIYKYYRKSVSHSHYYGLSNRSRYSYGYRSGFRSSRYYNRGFSRSSFGRSSFGRRSYGRSSYRGRYSRGHGRSFRR